MKHVFLLILVVCISCSSQKDFTGIKIIPQPESVKLTGGFYRMKSDVTIACTDKSAEAIISVFTTQLKDRVNVRTSGDSKTDIEIKTQEGKPADAYSLQVTKNKIIISAGSESGVFYGLQSLRQIIVFSESKNGRLLIPCGLVEDAPEYPWRGLMLDESRHFFGVEKVKQLLDMMAMHKLNIFHWHLTDVPGWRLVIKKYPRLTTVGSIGNHSDSLAAAKFYTQAQIIDIVKYASERFIQIVPEIDMPGHAGASNRAYPEFSGGGSKDYPEFTFNPGYEGTYGYLTDILKEITEMFPSPWIHLGGDEVHFGNQQWNTSLQVRSLMRKNNLPDLKAVEKYFVRRMSDTIQSLKKTTIGWDEIIDAGISPGNSIVMWWRHDRQDQLKNAFAAGYRVILCPRIPLYFDFVQYKEHKWGRRWKGKFSDLENVYRFPPDTLSGLKESPRQVIGIQANLWTEVISTDKRLDFMTYPRLSALAEAAWTGNELKDYDNFLARLKPMLNYLGEKGIYYFDPFNPLHNPEPAGPGK